MSDLQKDCISHCTLELKIAVKLACEAQVFIPVTALARREELRSFDPRACK